MFFPTSWISSLMNGLHLRRVSYFKAMLPSVPMCLVNMRYAPVAEQTPTPCFWPSRIMSQNKSLFLISQPRVLSQQQKQAEMGAIDSLSRLFSDLKTRVADTNLPEEQERLVMTQIPPAVRKVLPKLHKDSSHSLVVVVKTAHFQRQFPDIPLPCLSLPKLSFITRNTKTVVGVTICSLFNIKT